MNTAILVAQLLAIPVVGLGLAQPLIENLTVKKVVLGVQLTLLVTQISFLVAGIVN